MGRKISEVSGPGKEVKAKVNMTIFNALEIIRDKFGRSHSDVIKTALSDYILKNYPDLFKKTDIETRLQAEEEILLSEYRNKISDKRTANESIPSYEKSQKKLNNTINDLQKKLNTKSIDSKKESITKKQKEELKEEIYDLEVKISGCKNERDINKDSLERLKEQQKF